MKRVLSLAIGGFVAPLLALGSAQAVSAHAVIPADPYRVAIGWAVEPAYVGEVNAIQVFVDTAGANDSVGTPVGDLNADCSKADFQITVKVGTTTSSPYCPAPKFDADTNSGRPDEYDYPLTPTVPGTYTFHIYGTIHGAKIDKTINSGDSTFDSPSDPSAVDFPTAVPPLGAVVTKVNQVDSRAAAAADSASSASSSANTARILAIVALALAVLLGGASAVMGRRRQ